MPIVLGEWYNSLLIVMAAFPRMIAFFTAVPALGGQLIPALTRNALCLSLIVFLFPLLAATAPAEIKPTMVTLIMLKEAGIGFTLGFFAGLVFHLVIGAGNVIAANIGGAEAMTVGPTTGEEMTVMAAALFQTLVTVFFVNGGALILFGALFRTYEVWPVFSPLPLMTDKMPELIGRAFTGYFGAMLLFAAPVLIAMFLVLLGMGLINRFAPRLNVFILSMPIKSAVALLVIVLSLGFMSLRFRDGYGNIPDLFNAIRNSVVKQDY